jgi:integrase
MRERHKTGSVVLDRRIKLWNYFYWDAGKRRSKRIGTLREFPTKASAWKAAKELRHSLETKLTTAPTINLLVEQYRIEKMPTRHDTRGGYESWLRVYYPHVPAYVSHLAGFGRYACWCKQKLMRHSDIRTTMNIYGDAVTPDMREASSKVAMLALNGR